jgi:hypothetical protein
MTRRFQYALTLLVLVVIGAAGFVTRDEPNRSGELAPVVERRGVRVVETFEVRLSLPGGGPVRLASNGDLLRPNEVLVAVRPRGFGVATVQVLSADSLPIEPSPRREPYRLAEQLSFVRLPLSGTDEADVIDWDADGLVELVGLRSGAESVRVTVVSAAPPYRWLERGFARIRRVPFATRTLAIAHWSGSRPDLFVLDRLPGARTVRVSIFSGESGFEQRTQRIVVPLRGLGGDVALDVGRVESARADLLALERGEPHRVLVLSGESSFRRRVVASVGVVPGERILLSRRLGQAAVYGVTLERLRGRVAVATLRTRRR